MKTSLDECSRRTAQLLLEIDAVRFRAEDPFRLASGRLSPVYVDCRRIISFPEARSEISDMLVQLIVQDAGTGRIDNIAGGETAGIPFAAFVAERMGLPMSYIRKKPKGYGRNARIEGEILPRQRVLLIEDLATDGGSKLGFVNAIREFGAECTEVIVVFHYGIFPEAEAELSRNRIRIHSLCTWGDILAVGSERGLIDTQTIRIVRDFLGRPQEWKPSD